MFKKYIQLNAIILLLSYSALSYSAEMMVIDKECIGKVNVVDGVIRIKGNSAKCSKKKKYFTLNDSVVIISHSNNAYYIDDFGWRVLPEASCCDNLPEVSDKYYSPIWIISAEFKQIIFKNTQSINALRIISEKRGQLRGYLCIFVNNKSPACFTEAYEHIKEADDNLAASKKFPEIKTLFKPKKNEIEFKLNSYNYMGGGVREFYSKKYLITESGEISE